MPTARPAGPSVDASVIPQGLSLADPGLSGITQLPRPAAIDPAQIRAAKLRLLLLTAIPPCLVLGISLPLFAGGWFLLDRFSLARDNAFGIGIPIGLAVAGMLFLVATALFIAQTRRLAPRSTTIDSPARRS